MSNEATNVIQECAALSMAGKLSFGDVVGRLMQAGVERYHADYTRGETTYYLLDGESCVVPVEHGDTPIAQAFAPDQVQASIRQSQRGEIVYPQFIRQTTAAGCVGYSVHITGKRVHYFGRAGDIHTEWFPGAKPVGDN